MAASGLILAGGMALNAAAFAADPVALVEDVSDAAAGVAAFDYLPTGKVVELGRDGRLVVDYLRSCAHETIVGGIVTIGIDHSLATGGSFKSEKVECHGTSFRLTTEQAARAGVLVLRDMPLKQEAADGARRIDQTIYGSSPLIDMSGALRPERSGKVRLVVERLDVPGERVALDIAPEALVRGAFYDFAAAGRALQPDGIYRLAVGKISVVLKVDRFAAAGHGPVLGRLVRL